MNEPALILTDPARSAAKQLQAEVSDYLGKDLRIYLAGKGCDGFDYGIAFDDRETDDIVVPLNEAFALLCDKKTMEFVCGSTIDWVDDSRGRGFVVNNPNHKKFRGKFFKKSEWKSRLATDTDNNG